MKKVALLTGAVLAVGFSSHATIIADWTFETSQPATAGPVTPESGVGIASGSHAGAAVYGTPTGNGSAHSFSSTLWAINDYYQFEVSTVGFSSITLNYDQISSNTGPGHYKLQYSTDGTTFTTFVTDYTVLANATPNSWTAGTPVPATSYSDDLRTVLALNNAPTVFIRMVDDSTTAANGGTVAVGGTDRMDNVVISGVLAPEPSTMALLGMGGVAGAFFFGRRNRK